MPSLRSDRVWFYGPLAIAVAALIVALVVSPGPQSSSSPTQTSLAVRVDAVEPGEPLPPYDRTAMFGRPWVDVDGNGCRQRDDILAADLVEVVLAEDGCKVLSGVLAADPYTGERVEFTFGQRTSSAVQIDHIYSLRDAYDDGALDLTYEERVAFANDPRNLIATKGSVNGAKGSLGPSDWASRITTDAECGYLGRYLLLAAEYGLEVDQVDLGYIEAALPRCGIDLLTDR